jgi:hypothetical protein
MAVTKIIQHWTGGGGEDEKAVVTLERHFTVMTDTDADGVPTVLAALVAVDASTALYAPHPDYAPAVCRSRTARREKGPRVWSVVLTYSSAPIDLENNQNTQADQRLPTVSVSRKEVTEPLEYDVDTGDRVLNTVGDPFAPPAEVFRSRHIITWKFWRTEAQLDWDNRSQWLDYINADAVTVLGCEYPVHSLRCVDYSLDTTWDRGAAGLQKFYALTVQAEYNPATWDVVILNTGLRRMTGSIGLMTAKLTAIVDAHGQPVSDPVPLTSAGVPVPPGDPYHYVQVSGYLEANWNGTGGTLTGAGGILE